MTESSRREPKVFDTIHEISKLYVESMNQIQELLSGIEGVTYKLDEKIERLLRQQELEFMKAYRCHLHHLNEALRLKDEEILNKHKQLKFFENEGAYSELIQKARKLEQENSAIYEKSKLREKMLNDCRLEIRILKLDNKRLMEEIKKLLRQKRLAQANTLVIEEEKIAQTHKRLLTELGGNRRLADIFMTQAHTRSMSDQTGFIMGLDTEYTAQQQEEQNKIGSVSRLQIQNIKLSRQVKNINSKYSKLLKDTVERECTRTELQDFFFNCIKQVKKSICSRRKTTDCNLNDFLHDDKVKVLLTLLTHQEIVKNIHRLIFSQNKDQPQRQESKSIGVFSLSDEPQLPRLKVEELRARSLINRRLRVKNGKLQS